MLKSTLYVIPSGLKNADFNKTVDSFSYYNDRVDKDIVLIDNWRKASSIRDIMTQRNGNEDDWFVVLYDNEHITIGIAHSFYLHLNSDADVLVMMKIVDGMINQSPRAFRNFVRLPGESLLPEKDAINLVTKEPLKYNRVLDGWIREHV